MTEQEQKEYLIKLIEEHLTIQSDESEGTQSVAMDFINACSPDYIDMEQPAMSIEQIMHMLHIDDPNIFPSQRQRAGRETDAALHPIENLGRKSDDDSGEGKRPGGGSTYPGPEQTIIQPGSGSGSEETITNHPYPEDTITHPENFFKPEDIRYPDGTETDKVIDAIINDDSFGTVNAVIEFAQPCIRDPKGVDYKFLVKPGQQIDINTIIATATIDGKQKRVKSIFSSGTVAATPDGRDFKRLYKDAGADRHIVLENCEISGILPELDMSFVRRVEDQFRNEASLFQLISDNLCESVLPWILNRRNPFSMPLLPPIMNGRFIFSKYMEHIKDIREVYHNDLRNMCEPDNIKSHATSVGSLNALGNSILARRKRFMREILEAYTDYKNTLPQCPFDPMFQDCSYLAYLGGVEIGYEHTSTYIGNERYDNYYVALLSRVDMQSENKYAKRYFQLLSEIIENRIAREGYSINGIKDQFNEIYRDMLGGGRISSNPYSALNSAMRKVKGDVTFGDVQGWIAQHTTNQGNYTGYIIRQLSNIYMFIRNYHAKGLPTRGRRTSRGGRFMSLLRGGLILPEDIIELTAVSMNPLGNPAYKLIVEENKKLCSFWNEVIGEYLGIDFQKMVDDIQRIPDSVSDLASWPVYSLISDREKKYNLYHFQNGPQKRQQKDDSIGSDINDQIPKEPDSVQPPDVGKEELPLNDTDMQDGEIGIQDYDYWVKYFALATVISLPFLNCGLDIPPDIMFIPLPCIFICLGVVFIQPLDVIMVFGLSIRGMYIWPIVLLVNPSNHPCNVTTPLVAMMKNIQSKISAKINALTDLPITSIANIFTNMLENENRNLRRQNKQLEIALDQIATRKVEGQEEIKRRIDRLMHPGKKQTQKIIKTE